VSIVLHPSFLFGQNVVRNLNAIELGLNIIVVIAKINARQTNRSKRKQNATKNS
jgi:hypothetical protein